MHIALKNEVSTLPLTDCDISVHFSVIYLMYKIDNNKNDTQN